MTQTYTHILTLLFKHRYFNDGLFKSIFVSYADGTQKLLRDLEIIIKPFEGGLHLLAANPNIFDSISDSNPIQLYFYCKDPNYINYTELSSFSPSNELLYFNNLSSKTDSNNETFYLHNEEFLGDNEIVQLNSGKIQIPHFNVENDYRFTSATGDEIAAQCITHPAKQSDTFFLSNIPEGLVLLHTNKQEVDRFYCNPKAVWKKPFGIVEIYTSTLLNHFREKGIVEYALNFGNRKTIWKYFFTGPVYQKFNNLSIINKAKEQIFKGPETQQISDNYAALVFESKNKISISEHSDESFQLVDDYQSGVVKGKIVIKSLPKASPEQLFWDDTKSADTIYSHIYI